MSALLISLGLALGQAQAGATPRSITESGNVFLAQCTAEPIDRLVCASYVIGLWDGAIAFNRWACLPNGASYEQLLDVGIDFIRENPSMRHRPTRDLLLVSWRRAFPCPKAGAE
jgi:hypothetical protein